MAGTTYICVKCDVTIAADCVAPGGLRWSVCNPCIESDAKWLAVYRALRKDPANA